MESKKVKSLNRRNLIRHVSRTVILGGLIGIGGMVTGKNRNRKQGEDCPILRPCRACESLRHCNLPQALSAKQTSKERNHG